MDNFKDIAARVLAFMLTAIIYTAAFQFSWNLIMPYIFSLPKITLLQSFYALGFLSLVGNFFRG